MARRRSTSHLRNLATQLKSLKHHDVLVALDYLTKIYGLQLQNFFQDYLPSVLVSSNVHKKMEQEVWRQFYSDALSCSYDPARFPLEAYIWKVAWDKLLDWRLSAPGHIRQLPLNGNPQRYHSVNPAQALTLQQFYRDLLECLAELKQHDPKQYDAVVFILLVSLTYDQTSQAMGCVHGTAGGHMKDGRMFLARCLARRGWRHVPQIM